MRLRLLLFLFLIPLVSTPSHTSHAIVEEIISLLQSGSQHDYIGENISQLEHALQCAQLAKDAHADEERIIAALLHDIGHLLAHEDTTSMNGYGSMYHEVIGANYIQQQGFSTKIAELIKGHVSAKRYLTYANPEYYATLSHASKETLKMQGGPMTAQEAQEFEQDPLFKEKLIMRFWDEQAKEIDRIVSPLESYRDLLLNNIKQPH